ncbi:hypothetical protein HMPREF9075_02196 [Capnocytophaga sp. oral taxon 332 str. F0381]|nr:hypothetical protein HMPREF9075_02196 [Capnocytophaga sp. oral taxon 332 str. F0381]
MPLGERDFFIFELCHILSCASSLTFLRLSFAQPSLKVRSRFGGTNGLMKVMKVM